jgi:hypothetical protein
MVSLMYLTNIKPNICFVVNTLIHHLEQPRQVLLVATKHVLRYLKGTLDHGLWYRYDHEFGLYGYLDSDWVDIIHDQKSTSRYCSSLGSSMVSWSIKKKSCVELSLAKAEYVATCATSIE